MTDNALQFRAAVLSDFPELLSMWQESFHETCEAAESIFKLLQKPENIFVLAGKNGVAAMLSVRELSLTSPENSCKAAYIYGVASSPSCRGKGYATSLLYDADVVLSQRQYACSVLVPASESLFGFYEKRGYETAFNINKAEFTGGELKPSPVYKLEKISGERLALIRGARFGDSRMFACWDAEYLDYIAAESGFYGGGAYAAAIEGSQACAVCYKDGDTVYVKELGAERHALEAALRSIHAHFGAERYKVYLRGDVKLSYTNNLLPFAMVKWYDKEIKAAFSARAGAACGGAPPYIAHVLD